MKKNYFAIALVMSVGLLAGCSSSPGTLETTAAPATTAAASATTAAALATSNWPSGKTVNLYVPAAAGGGSDMIARVFAQAMNEETGANFVVINDATGGGSVAAETVRNAKTDGLTLYLGHTGLCGSIAIGQYDRSFRDFQMLGTITVPAKESNAICINSDLPYQSIDELIQASQEKPGELLVGVQANGNRHFMQLLFQNATGTDFTIVDCGGVADTITNLVGGMVDMAILPVANASQYVEAGDLRALAITGDYEVDAFPGVPTMEAAGYKNVDLPTVSLLMGPSGMSEDDVAKISQVMKNVLESQEVIDKYRQMAMEAGYMTPTDAASYVDSFQDLYNTAATEMK